MANVILKIFEVLGFVSSSCRGGQVEFVGEAPSPALYAAVLALPDDEVLFRALNLNAQTALVSACSHQQLKDLNQLQRKRVQKARIQKYTGQQNPPEDSLDGIALDALADALQEALDEGENTMIKASRFAGWLAERATVQAEYPYPPDVPD